VLAVTRAQLVVLQPADLGAYRQEPPVQLVQLVPGLGQGGVGLVDPVRAVALLLGQRQQVLGERVEPLLAQLADGRAGAPVLPADEEHGSQHEKGRQHRTGHEGDDDVRPQFSPVGYVGDVGVHTAQQFENGPSSDAYPTAHRRCRSGGRVFRWRAAVRSQAWWPM